MGKEERCWKQGLRNEMVRKERQADMNRKTGITTTKRQLQLQLEGGGNRRACAGMSRRCVTLGVAGSEDSPSPASAPGVPGTSSPLLACARHERKRSKTGARSTIQQQREQRQVSVFVARKRGCSPSRHRSWSQRLSGCDLLLHSYAKPLAPALHQRAHLTDGQRGGGQRLSARACRRPGVSR